MKNLHAIKLLIVLVALVSFEANAIKASAVASVEIVEPTALRQESGFGKFNINKSESFFKRIFSRGKQSEEYLRKIPESEFRISGSKNNAIQIAVASTNASESKVKIDDFVVSYSNGADGGGNDIVRSAPGRDAKLKLGATLKVKSDAQSGYYEPDFNIAIYYE